jgi:hypothetical protein
MIKTTSLNTRHYFHFVFSKRNEAKQS